MADRAKAKRSLELIPIPAIQKQIVVVRERQVMLDEDLADLYGVETRRLIEQVKRNSDRFPPDFMFQLTKDEAAALRSQNATSNTGRGGRRYAPLRLYRAGCGDALERPQEQECRRRQHHNHASVRWPGALSTACSLCGEPENQLRGLNRDVELGAVANSVEHHPVGLG
jgi:hypothetical protein